MPMIEISDLYRSFNGRTAVDGISLAVEPGEIFGFLGPNGAGKTTTIRILTGQLLPSRGSARVAGFDCATQAQKLKPLIGVVFEQQNIYERMTGQENLAFFASLYGAPSRRVEEALKQVGLTDRARDKVKAYSNGMKQRLVIARALLNQPKVLFLDEPTRGLDPAAAREIRQMVSDLGKAGTTVFLTTHYMEEADQLCQRVAFLNEGRIVALDQPRELKIAYGQRVVKVLLKGEGSGVREQPSAVSRSSQPSEISLAMDNPADVLRLNDYMTAGKVLTVHSEEASLEDIFIRLTGRGLM